eukprot:364490-Chlamydomonas_euryale.AAC.10
MNAVGKGHIKVIYLHPSTPTPSTRAHEAPLCCSASLTDVRTKPLSAAQHSSGTCTQSPSSPHYIPQGGAQEAPLCRSASITDVRTALGATRIPNWCVGWGGAVKDARLWATVKGDCKGCASVGDCKGQL